MTHIRSAMAAALIVFGGATIAAAQQPTQPAQGQVLRHAKGPGARGKAAKRLFKGVQLSTAERANLKAVRQKYAEQRKTLRASGDRTQLMALRKSEHSELRGALAPSNQAKFDANAAALQRRAAKRGKPVTP